MKNDNKNITRKIVVAGLTAALYAVLTVIFAPISFGAVQFRISEMLTVLPLFTVYSVPGLALGCFLANLISSPFAFDAVFGAAATLLAAIFTYVFRKITVKGLPVLSMIFPTVINALIIGAEVAFTASGADTSRFMLFITSSLWVALGETVSSFIPGLLLYKPLKKAKILKD